MKAKDMVLNSLQLLSATASPARCFQGILYKEKLCQLFISTLQLTHSYWSKQRAIAYSIHNKITQQKPQGSLTQPSILGKIHQNNLTFTASILITKTSSRLGNQHNAAGFQPPCTCPPASLPLVAPYRTRNFTHHNVNVII